MLSLLHFAHSSCVNPLNSLLTEMSRGFNWLVNPPGITVRCIFSLVASPFVDSVTCALNWLHTNKDGFLRKPPGRLDTYPWRIRCRSNLGHIFQGKKVRLMGREMRYVCFLKCLKIFKSMKLILWYCDWIVLEEYLHVVNFVILNAECILASVVDKCIQYYFCLYRDKKIFILWKVLWKKYYSSVPSMHRMEFIINWARRKNRITLLKLMKLEGKDLEVKQETCAALFCVSYNNTHVISSMTIQPVPKHAIGHYPETVLSNCHLRISKTSIWTFHCLCHKDIHNCVSVLWLVVVLVQKVFVFKCKVYAIKCKVYAINCE